MIKKVKVSSLKNNLNNPRLIKDDKFYKLVESVKTFPEMLESRPIVVNQEMVVLGDNMRLKALIEAGIKEALVHIVDWPEEKQREFVIKDNVAFGEWDWNELANAWDTADLADWGLDIPNYALGSEFNSMDENELNMNQEFDPIGVASDLHKIIFTFDNEGAASNWISDNFPNGLKYNVTSGNGQKQWQVNLTSIYGK